MKSWLRRRTKPAVAVVIAVVLLGAGAILRPKGDRAVGRGALDAAGLLQSAVSRATAPGPIAAPRFPADHASHPDSPVEIWSVTGVLDDGAGRRAPVQLSLFRLALPDVPAGHPSAWATDSVYAGLLAVGVLSDGTLHAEVRASRGAVGLAGTRVEPTRVWLEDWQIVVSPPTGDGSAIELDAGTGAVSLRLSLAADGRLVDSRTGGAFRSDEAAPFAFYTYPSLAVHGTLAVDGEARTVAGRAAFEHAWGALPLPGGPTARDRFTLFLDDGRVIQLIRTYVVDGPGAPTVGGVLVRADGTARFLTDDSVELSVAGYQRSERSGRRYPVEWTLAMPAEALSLRLVPDRAKGEIDVWLPAWIGTVRIEADSPGVSGAGILQLSGDGRSGGG